MREEERVRNLEGLGRAEGGGNFMGGENVGNFWGSPRAPRRFDAQLPEMEE